MRVSPYAVHASYIFGGVAAKKNRFREDQIWLDDPSYYDVPKLLTVEIDIPAVPDNFQRLRNDYLAEVHLKMMQLQLDQAPSLLMHAWHVGWPVHWVWGHFFAA
jgi:hypothetical protein